MLRTMEVFFFSIHDEFFLASTDFAKTMLIMQANLLKLGLTTTFSACFSVGTSFTWTVFQIFQWSFQTRCFSSDSSSKTQVKVIVFPEPWRLHEMNDPKQFDQPYIYRYSY